MPKKWLFTDLDGTLIPLEGNTQNVADLAALKALIPTAPLGLTFITGRHLESAVAAWKEFDLPTPEWIICDVGTTITQIIDGSPTLVPDYHRALTDKTSSWNAERLLDELLLPSTMTLQESEKQGDFKISFYADAARLAEVSIVCKQEIQRTAAPYGIISSVDPFTGDGLVDFLPSGVDKAFAARWLADHLSLDFYSDVVYAGDSGNDTAALTAGCHAIVVGNAHEKLIEHLHSVIEPEKLVGSALPATSGVLGGVQQFLASK